MVYKISPTTVIDSSQNVYSTSSVVATNFIGKGTIPVNSTVVFNQTNAPTGFTKVTTYNDYALRIVSGTGGLTGGSVNFSTAFPSSSTTPISITGTASNTLTTAQLPTHTHPGSGIAVSGSTQGVLAGSQFIARAATLAAGGGAAHPHPVSGSTSADFRVKYVDVILATRDA